MTTYKLYKTLDNKMGAFTTKENGSMVSFLLETDNTDYQEYLKWLAEGNEPLPPDSQE